MAACKGDPTTFIFSITIWPSLTERHQPTKGTEGTGGGKGMEGMDGMEDGWENQAGMEDVGNKEVEENEIKNGIQQREGTRAGK